MHPVHVPSNRQGAPARKQEGSYTCKIQAEIRVEHGESLRGSGAFPHDKPAKCSRLHLIQVWKPKLDPF